jgi:hypothetical protein
MHRALLATTVAALILAAPAASDIGGGPHDAKVGEVVVFTVRVKNTVGHSALHRVTIEAPDRATLLSETGPPGWVRRSVSGRTTDWRGSLPAGATTRFRLRLLFDKAGTTSVFVRLQNPGTFAAEQAPLIIAVAGSGSRISGSLKLAIVVGGLVIVLALGLVLAGARRLR